LCGDKDNFYDILQIALFGSLFDLILAYDNGNYQYLLHFGAKNAILRSMSAHPLVRMKKRALASQGWVRFVPTRGQSSLAGRP
jgi:hypothetical protein